MKKISVPPGTRFGRLVVVKEVEKQIFKSGGIGRRIVCSCDCGTTTTVLLGDARKGAVKSCGCLKRMKSPYTEGGRFIDLPEYKAWYDILRRCDNPKTKHYQRYGGRGITVCERWRSFDAFFYDTGRRPSPKHSIDRINNDAHYSCGVCLQCTEKGWNANCHWATQQEQNLNRITCHHITYKGITLTLRQWERRLGFKKSLISARLKLNWSIEKALTTPVRSKN